MKSLPAQTASKPRVGAGFVSVYSLVYFGAWMALLTPLVVTLALRVADIDVALKESKLSLVLGVGAIVAVLLNPIAGLFSDRPKSRLSTRRPWLIGGMPLGWWACT